MERLGAKLLLTLHTKKHTPKFLLPLHSPPKRKALRSARLHTKQSFFFYISIPLSFLFVSRLFIL